MTQIDPDRDRAAPGAAEPGRNPPPPKKRPWWIWLLPLLALLLLVLLLRSCGGDEPVEQATIDPAAPGSAPPEPALTTAPPVGPAADTVTLPGGETLNAAPGTLNTQLAAFLAGSQPTPQRFTFENLHFATGSADLPPEARQTGAGLVQILRAYPNARIRIEGYADARGSTPANQQLGARRAEVVRAALVAAGIPANRIEAASGGEANPVATNATAPGQAENRRTDLVVLSR